MYLFANDLQIKVCLSASYIVLFNNDQEIALGKHKLAHF
jgi:hypothetical protein